MDAKRYQLVEDYMRRCMIDSAHDREHVYRVLYTALMIAREEPEVDWEVLTCACLLHDIGRKEQFENPALCHAEVGAEKAFRFLTDNGFGEDFAERVRECIAAHRFRRNNQPRTPEAKILFDADKLDVAGAMGIARSLLYQGYTGTPLYNLSPDGEVLDGTGEREPPFFREYRFKLEKLYDRFYTRRGRELALSRRQAAVDFYEALLREARESNEEGRAALKALLQE